MRFFEITQPKNVREPEQPADQEQEQDQQPQPQPQPKKPNRFQWNMGPDSRSAGAPEVQWEKDPESGYSRQTQAAIDWHASEQGKAHAAARDAAFKQSQADYKAHKSRHGKFDVEFDEFPNPKYSPENDDEEDGENFQPDLIDVGVDYESNWEGEDIPASWDDPGESAELMIDIKRIVDLETGEDITDIADTDEVIRRIEDQEGSYTDWAQDHKDQAAIDRYEANRDNYSDYNESLNRIKNLSGLK